MPSRFMREIGDGTCDKRQTRQTRRGRELADDEIIRAEINGRDNCPIGEGLDNRMQRVERVDPPGSGAVAECAVGAARPGPGDGAARRRPLPKLNLSRQSRRGAKTAAPPINKPGMSAASMIAAPATTAPTIATFPTTPRPKTALGCQPVVSREDIVKAFSIIRSLSGDIEQARKCRRLVTAE